MDIALLAQALIGLLFLLGILIFALLYNSKKRQKAPKLDATTSLNALKKIIKNQLSTTQELQDALNLILKHHGTITPKIGLRAHPDFDVYIEILFTIARHHNANKEIILSFDKELEKRNPEYKKNINSALMQGLNSRGT